MQHQNKALTPSRQVNFAPGEHAMPTPHLVETLFDRPIAFHRVFAELTNSITAGLMLSQAVYWSKRTKDAEGWFYKKQFEWFDETFLTRREQDTARATLRGQQRTDAKGKLLPPFWFEERRGLPAKIFYRVDFDTLLLHLEALHRNNAQNRQTELAVEPDLTRLPAQGNAPKRQTGLAENANLDATKAPDRKVRKRPSGKYENANPSLQRLHAETTTHTTHHNGRVRVLSEDNRSAFTIKQWLTYAKTQANINHKMAFANAMARTPDHDGVLELYLEIQRQEKEAQAAPAAGCQQCNFTGWEHVPSKGVKPCECRSLAPAQLKGR